MVAGEPCAKALVGTSVAGLETSGDHHGRPGGLGGLVGIRRVEPCYQARGVPLTY